MKEKGMNFIYFTRVRILHQKRQYILRAGIYLPLLLIIDCAAFASLLLLCADVLL